MNPSLDKRAVNRQNDHFRRFWVFLAQKVTLSKSLPSEPELTGVAIIGCAKVVPTPQSPRLPVDQLSSSCVPPSVCVARFPGGALLHSKSNPTQAKRRGGPYWGGKPCVLQGLSFQKFVVPKGGIEDILFCPTKLAAENIGRHHPNGPGKSGFLKRWAMFAHPYFVRIDAQFVDHVFNAN